MMPTLSVCNEIDRTGRYAELFGDYSYRHTLSEGGSNFKHLATGELCGRVSFAMGMSSFRSHVCGVRYCVSKKQVVRIDTWRIVATMQHPQSFWDRAIVQFPRYSVGLEWVRIGLYEPVTSFESRSGPFPTMSGNNAPYSAPVARLKRHWRSCADGTLTRAPRVPFEYGCTTGWTRLCRLFLHRSFTPFGASPRPLPTVRGPVPSYCTASDVPR